MNLNVLDRSSSDLLDIGSVLDQASRILRQERILENIEQADIVITPDLRGFTPADFDRADELIELGRHAAQTHREELLALSRRLERSGEEPRRPVPPESNREVTVADVRLVTPPTVGTPSAIPVPLTTVVGETTTVQDIQRRVYALYDGAEFEYVSYDLIPNADGSHDVDVYVVAGESPDARVSVGLGVRTQLVENAYTRILLHTNYVRGLGESDAELELDGWFTDVGSARAGVSLPVRRELRGHAALYALTSPFYFYDGRVVESQYLQYRLGGELGVTGTLTRRWLFELDGFGEWFDLARQRGAQQLEIDGFPRYGVSVGVSRDSLNRPLFPTRGGEARLEYRLRWNEERRDPDSRGEFVYRRYVPLSSRVTLAVRTSGGTDFGSGLPLYERFATGGAELLDGYYYQELRGNHIVTGGMDLRIALFDMPIGTGEHGFLRIGANGGSTWNSGTVEDLIQEIAAGAKVAVAMETVLGELNLGVAVSRTGRVLSFLLLGPASTTSGMGYDW